MTTTLPAVPPPDGEPTDTGVRLTEEAWRVAVLVELREQRARIEALTRATLLAYLQEIGRSTLPGGVRLDVVLVLALATALGLFGAGSEWLGRLLGVGVAP